MNHFRTHSSKIRGPLVPILSAFKADGSLDIDSTCRWIEWLLDQGMKLFWTTHGTSHYMTLTDQELIDLNKALASVIAGRGFFIASTPIDWSTNQCQIFTEQAAGWGVDAVKLQLDWRWEPSDALLLSHYQTVAASSPLPLLAYTFGKPGISPDLLRRIIEIPQFIGLKNDTDDYYGHELYLRTVRTHSDPDEFVVMTGGGLSSVFFGYEFGVKAYGDGIAWFAPRRSLEFYHYMEAGQRDKALHFIKKFEEPTRLQWSALGIGQQWSWGHTVLELVGFFESRNMRFPLQALSNEQAAAARAFLEKWELLPG